MSNIQKYTDACLDKATDSNKQLIANESPANKAFLLACMTESDIESFKNALTSIKEEHADFVPCDGGLMFVNNIDILKYLVKDYELNVNFKNANGNTIAEEAFKNTNTAIIKFLIEEGAEFRNLENMNEQVVKFLVDSGYAPFVNDIQGKMGNGSLPDDQLSIAAIVEHLQDLDTSPKQVYDYIINKGLKGDLLNSDFQSKFSFMQLKGLMDMGVKISVEIMNGKNNEKVFTMNKIDYFGNKQIVLDQCKVLKNIIGWDLVEKDGEFPITIDGIRDKVIKVFMETFTMETYDILHQLDTDEIIELARIVDQYPTTKLNIEILEWWLCETFNVKYLEFYENLASRYKLLHLVGECLYPGKIQHLNRNRETIVQAKERIENEKIKKNEAAVKAAEKDEGKNIKVKDEDLDDEMSDDE